MSGFGCYWRVLVLTVLVAGACADTSRAEFETRWQRAHEERLSGQTQKALEDLKDLLAAIRGKTEFRDLRLKVESEMSEAYLTEKDPANAVVYLEDLVAERPTDTVSQYKLGMVYRDLGDSRRATVHLRAAVEGGFSNLAVQVNLIEAAFLAKQSTLALNTAKKLLEKPVKSADVLLRVGKGSLRSPFLPAKRWRHLQKPGVLCQGRLSRVFARPLYRTCSKTMRQS